ncbi:MAG: hypothetical protein J7639_24790 [Paenibacillaceae bacterium]|nr:hypothetical protein [Paenibacillaceae bacterium]
MKRHEVLSALDRINEMSDHEIAINAKWIREVANKAYMHIKQRDEKQNQPVRKK